MKSVSVCGSASSPTKKTAHARKAKKARITAALTVIPTRATSAQLIRSIAVSDRAEIICGAVRDASENPDERSRARLAAKPGLAE